MKTRSLTAAAAMLGVVIAVSPVATAQATELQILAGGGMTAALQELGAQFQSTSGHKLVFRFGTTPELIKMATAGAMFDLGIVPREVFEDAAAKAEFAPGPTTDVARVGLGVAVRAGGQKPDITTPDALKQTLLNAQSIAFTPESAAGAQVLRVFERLGIADAMKAKTRVAARAGADRSRGRKGRGRAWRVSDQRIDRARHRSGRSVPGEPAGGGRLHGGARQEHPANGCREGVHRLSDDAGRGSGAQGQRHDAGLG